MKLTPAAVLCTLTLVYLAASPAWPISARAEADLNNTSTYSRIIASYSDPVIPWPVKYGMQRTGMVDACFDCYGQIGEGYRPWMFTIDEWPIASFDTPPLSAKRYLFGGGLWIGGILAGDTSVSTAVDGYWAEGTEFSPPDERGSVTKFDYPTDYSMRAQFTDTCEYTDPAVWPYPDHRSLNIEVFNRSHVWRTAEYEDIIIYDIVISNIGSELIESTFVGFYFDVDISKMNTMWTSGYTDDIAGSLREYGVGYVIDNDGDPFEDMMSWDEEESVRKIFAFKLLASSREIVDTNFSWWTQENVVSGLIDFSPRLKPTPEDPYYDFGTGGTGIPRSDLHKYYVLSHREWDYDQVYTAGIQPDDPLWSYPPPEYSVNITDGMDTKFLMSYGPFDLEPGSDLRLIVTTFTADAVHEFPLNILNLPDYPYGYIMNLNFDEVYLNAQRAADLADSLLNPAMPVVSPRIEHRDWDSVVVAWDPWVFDNIDGYQLYLSEIPIDLFPYPGTPPPWLRPQTLVPLTSLGDTNRFTCESLDPDKFYFFNVAHRVAGEVGSEGTPVFINQRGTDPGPEASPEYAYFVPGGAALVRWTPPPGDFGVDHYNIYRFEDREIAQDVYHPYYSTYIPDSAQQGPIDFFYVDGQTYYYFAMIPYAVTDSGITSFEDPNTTEGICYVISAVNDAGFETEFSDVIETLESAAPTKDVLVISELGTNAFVPFDSIASFYHTVLSAYDYDIYNVWDTLMKYDCFPVHEGCFDWRDLSRYKLVLYDGEGYDEFLEEATESEFGIFRKYLLTGQPMVYFGSFYGMNSFDHGEAASYSQNDWFVGRFFGIDSVFYYHYRYYYYNDLPRNLDTCFGFWRAEGITDHYPDVTFNREVDYFAANIAYVWQDSTPPSVSVFALDDIGETIYRFRSAYPEDSWLEGRPVGIRCQTSETLTYLFGFHLWYMEPQSATALIDSIFPDSQTDVVNPPQPYVAGTFELRQNYPNPFNPSTIISFSLPRASEVSLGIYNILGQRVKTLLNGKNLAAGNHSVEWEGDCDDGRKAATGVYFYRLAAGDQTESRKMLLLK